MREHGAVRPPHTPTPCPFFVMFVRLKLGFHCSSFPCFVVFCFVLYYFRAATCPMQQLLYGVCVYIWSHTQTRPGHSHSHFCGVFPFPSSRTRTRTRANSHKLAHQCPNTRTPATTGATSTEHHDHDHIGSVSNDCGCNYTAGLKNDSEAHSFFFRATRTRFNGNYLANIFRHKD